VIERCKSQSSHYINLDQRLPEAHHTENRIHTPPNGHRRWVLRTDVASAIIVGRRDREAYFNLICSVKTSRVSSVLLLRPGSHHELIEDSISQGLCRSRLDCDKCRLAFALPCCSSSGRPTAHLRSSIICRNNAGTPLTVVPRVDQAHPLPPTHFTHLTLPCTREQMHEQCFRSGSFTYMSGSDMCSPLSCSTSPRALWGAACLNLDVCSCSCVCLV